MSPLRITCPCGRLIQVHVSFGLMAARQPPDGWPHGQVPEVVALLPLERRVLALAASGERDQDIARGLGVSLYTVKRTVRMALVRLSARNRTEAVTRALALGLLEISD